MCAVGRKFERYGLLGKDQVVGLGARFRVREGYLLIEHQGVDQRVAIGRHCDPDWPFTGGDVGDGSVAGGVDHGEGGRVAVADIEFLAVLRQHAALGAVARGDELHFAGFEVDGGDVGRTAVADIGPLRAGPESHHVRGLAFGGEVFQDDALCWIDEEKLVRKFGGDGQVSGGWIEVDSVGTVIFSETDIGEFAACGHVDDGERVAACTGMFNPHGAVVGGVEVAAVGGEDHLMGMLTGGNGALQFAVRGIVGERAGALLQNQIGGRLRGCLESQGEGEEECFQRHGY